MIRIKGSKFKVNIEIVGYKQANRLKQARSKSKWSAQLIKVITVQIVSRNK